MSSHDNEPILPESGLPAGVSVVVPCYRSEGSLERLVEELGRVLPSCAERFEVILVNDDSPDDSGALIRSLIARYPWLVCLELMRNYGQHNATLAGARAARFDTIVTIDDDLQHAPEEIPKLLEKLREGYDVVYGTPARMPHSTFRNISSWLAKHAISIATQQGTVRNLSAFRAFRTALRGAFAEYRSPQVLFDVLLGWGSTRIVGIPVVHRPRAVGTSNYGLWKLASGVITLWIGYTTAPLRLASWLGFAFFVFGVGILVYVLRTYFFEGSVPGFPFLASSIAIFGGAQLFTLGIIGEYLARLFERSLDRPAYVVKSELRGATASNRRSAGGAEPR